MKTFAPWTGNLSLKNGRELRLRGVNLGNWMLIEAYMLGLAVDGAQKSAANSGESSARKPTGNSSVNYMEHYLGEGRFQIL